MTERPELSRRRFFELAGLTSLGGVLVACGAQSSGDEPGRVGYAPPIEQLPRVTIDDAVLLRTMTSMEYLMLDLYQWIKDQGAVAEQSTALIDRFVEDHQAAADELARQTTDVGGEPYECANDWYTQRILPGIEAAVTGDEATGTPPTEDPATDLMRISYGFETMMSSAYQKVIELAEA